MRTSHILAFANLGSVALAAVELYGQCGGSAYSGETACVSGACCTKANEWYSQCVACAGGGSGGTSPEETKAPTTTILGGGETSIVVVPTLKSTKVQTKSSTKKAQSTAVPAPTSGSGSGSGSVPQGVTRTLPKSSGAVSSSTAIPVKGSFDGGMKLYDRSPAVCKDQTETGEKDAMFILEDGATLSNVIIGPGQAEGVHCKGTCTLINVWFEDVCEDAITLKQTSGTSFIKGGGAFHASDKVVQFNGRGTVEISNFYAEDYGKLVRSCGNCKGNGGPRNVVIEGAVAVDGGVLCGINTNYGDTCTISNSCQSKGKDCDRFEGNDTGKEPKKIGSGPDGNFCRVDSFSKSC